MTNEAMTVKSSLMFVYGDKFKSNLITTIMVEIHARQVIYTKSKTGF